MPNGTRGAADPASRIAAAVSYAQRGWRVIPLHAARSDGSCTCPKQGLCPSTGKHPLDGGWQNTPPMTPEQVGAEWSARSWANVGVATGAPSGFWVLDIDPDAGGMETMAALVAQHGAMPPTIVQRTGSGGWHYFFALPDFEIRNTQQAAKKFGGPGIDVRGTGGQIVIAPSVSGKGPYALNDTHPIAPAPEWLLALLRPRAAAPAPSQPAAPVIASAPAAGLDAAESARLLRYTDRVVLAELERLHECTRLGWQGPHWNETTYSVACNLTELANSPWSPLDHGVVDAILLEHAPRDETFGDAEIAKRLRSARQTVGTNGRGYPAKPVDLLAPFAQPPRVAESRAVIRTWDDLGNAARIVDHYGDQLRYVAPDKTWAVWDGVHWVQNATDQAVSLIQRLIANLADVEADLYDDTEVVKGDKQGRTRRQMFKDWAAGQGMAARIEAAEKMARPHPTLRAEPGDFDVDPMLLNAANGIVDLRTGQLLPHDPAKMLSHLAPVPYDPAATAPRWEAFLAQVMPDASMRGYLQRISGYSITGDISEQAMFIHQGPGANGKSQYLVAMGKVLGSYNQIVPRQALITKTGDTIPTDIARMVGKRFLQSSETAVGRSIDEEVMKNLTGEEAVVARHLFGREFEFDPTGKIHYVTNHLPRVTNADSTWRRLHLISWNVIIPSSERVKSLGKQLARDEGAGILAWLVAGARAWQEIGLAAPDAARADLERYRVDADELGEFLGDFVKPQAGGRASIAAIYSAYVQWAAASGIGGRLMSRQTLSLAMQERNYKPYRSGTERGFTDIAVHSPMVAHAWTMN